MGEKRERDGAHDEDAARSADWTAVEGNPTSGAWLYLVLVFLIPVIVLVLLAVFG